MKSQCDKHGCSEMLCGCPTDCLEDNAQFWIQVRAKNKWIATMLEDQKELIRILRSIITSSEIKEELKKEALSIIEEIES